MFRIIFVCTVLLAVPAAGQAGFCFVVEGCVPNIVLVGSHLSTGGLIDDQWRFTDTQGVGRAHTFRADEFRAGNEHYDRLMGDERWIERANTLLLGWGRIEAIQTGMDGVPAFAAEVDRIVTAVKQRWPEKQLMMVATYPAPTDVQIHDAIINGYNPITHAVAAQHGLPVLDMDRWIRTLPDFDQLWDPTGVINYSPDVQFDWLRGWFSAGVQNDLSWPLPGDGDQNGRVDIDDLNFIRNHFGQDCADYDPLGNVCFGDNTFDGRYDIDDLNNIRNGFGAAYPDGSFLDTYPWTVWQYPPGEGPTTVPEPAGAALFACGTIFCLARRRRA